MSRVLHFWSAVLILACIGVGVSVVHAWSGPTQAPPNGNVSAPVNIGTTDQVKNAGLSVNALAVFGNSILSGTTNYLNFGTISGSSGYGFRNNSGSIEVKHSSGGWYRIATTTSAGQFPQIPFADGTVQTTAAGGASCAAGWTQMCGEWWLPPGPALGHTQITSGSGSHSMVCVWQCYNGAVNKVLEFQQNTFQGGGGSG